MYRKWYEAVTKGFEGCLDFIMINKKNEINRTMVIRVLRSVTVLVIRHVMVPR